METVIDVIGDHQSRAASLLLVAGLGVEIQIDDVTLVKNRSHTSSPFAEPQSSSRWETGSILSMGFP